MAQLRHRIPATELERAFREKRIDTFVRQQRFGLNLRKSVDTLEEGLVAAGRIADRQYQARTGIEVRFDATNPLAVSYNQKQGARLVREVNRSTRQAIRAIADEALRTKLTPRQAAQRIAQIIGIGSWDVRRVEKARTQWEAEGRSEEDISRRVEKLTDKFRRERAFTIARTELNQAINHGQLAYWHQLAEAGIIDGGLSRKVWITTPDEKRCVYCLAMDGQSVPLAAKFHSAQYGDIQSPGLHPRCRCAMGLQTALKGMQADWGDEPEPRAANNFDGRLRTFLQRTAGMLDDDTYRAHDVPHGGFDGEAVQDSIAASRAHKLASQIVEQLDPSERLTDEQVAAGWASRTLPEIELLPEGLEIGVLRTQRIGRLITQDTFPGNEQLTRQVRVQAGPRAVYDMYSQRITLGPLVSSQLKAFVMRPAGMSAADYLSTHPEALAAFKSLIHEGIHWAFPMPYRDGAGHLAGRGRHRDDGPPLHDGPRLQGPEAPAPLGGHAEPD